MRARVGDANVWLHDVVVRHSLRSLVTLVRLHVSGRPT